MSNFRVESLRGVLQAAAPLRKSGDPITKVVGERVSSIIVDALLELDPELDDPWDELLDAPTEELEQKASKPPRPTGSGS